MSAPPILKAARIEGDESMSYGLIWEESFGAFLFVTVALFGGTAFMSGRATARSWDPIWKLAAYMLLLAAACRFIHIALFHGTLLSLHYYLVDLVIILAVAWLGYRMTRAQQMVAQYGFEVSAAGPIGWRVKSQ